MAKSQVTEDTLTPPSPTPWLWFHRLGSPPYFYQLAGKLIPWVGGITLILLIVALYGGLIKAPADYQQGESYRIIFIHVPSAWMSMFVYMVLAVCGAIVLIWRMKLAEAVARASAPIGASFTALALLTGSLWGKPMWGTYWVWDARLTSELILLFLYLGYIALVSAIPDRRQGARWRGTGHRRRGQYPHHSLFRGMVEYLAPRGYRDQAGQTLNSFKHAHFLTHHGACFSVLFPVGNAVTGA